MCWSGEASTTLALIGTATTLYAAWKGEPRVLWITLGYFTLMEWLQAFTYGVIDDYESPMNQIATLLGYLHITFQPFFINAISMYFIPSRVAKKLEPWVYSFCFFSVIVMIIQLYPFDWAGLCDPARPLCGAKLGSFHGEWHIAWSVPTNSIGNFCAHTKLHGFPTYVLAGFVMPAVYGSWRFTIYHLLMGPVMSHLLTSNVNEWPAVWCLLSIAILIIVVKTPLRKHLFVDEWIFWRKEKPPAAPESPLSAGEAPAE